MSKTIKIDYITKIEGHAPKTPKPQQQVKYSIKLFKKLFVYLLNENQPIEGFFQPCSVFQRLVRVLFLEITE